MKKTERQLALEEVAALAVKKTDRRYTDVNSRLMEKRIKELVARWGFATREVWDQMRKQSS